MCAFSWVPCALQLVLSNGMLENALEVLEVVWYVVHCRT